MVELRTRWRSLPVCDDCWADLNPDRRPIRVIDAQPEKCIWCDALTESGIYVRGQVEIPVFDGAGPVQGL